jgi:hypothetical protein
MKEKKIIAIEHWLNGMTTSMLTEKKDFWNSIRLGFTGYLVLHFEDGTEKIVNK